MRDSVPCRASAADRHQPEQNALNRRAFRPYLAVLLAVMTGLLLAACGSDQPEPATARHPWLTGPPVEREDVIELSPWLVYRVAGERLAEAVAELDVQPYLQLSPGTAQHFAGQDLRVPAEMRPFLVRAVMAPDGDLRVFQLPLGLWIRAAATDAVVAQPLVVLLDPTPREIFVSVE